MLRRGIVGFGAVMLAILACRAVTLAQRQAPPQMVPGEPQSKSTESRGWSGRTKVATPDESPPPMPTEVPQSGTATPGDPLALDDPMGAVEAFLGRNRKEADESIQGLSREAETLRARLQKVEAALARWQGVAAALHQDQVTANPTPSPEPTPQLEVIKGGDPAPLPGAVEPPALTPEPPSVPPSSGAVPKPPEIEAS